jgi:hypothetical protein
MKSRSTKSEEIVMSNQSRTALEPLSVDRIVASGLPIDLRSEAAPDFYPVPTVFNREPSSDERMALAGEEGRAGLEKAGFPNVTLGIEDVRLLIGNTNLAVLESGLASAIGTLVDSISRRILGQHSRSRDEAEALSEDRAARRHDAASAAARIRFVPRPPGTRR